MMTKRCPTCQVDFKTKCGKYCSRKCFGAGKSKEYAARRDVKRSANSRTCRKCGLVGDVSLFCKTSKKRAGYESVCKECNKARVKAWRKRNPDKVREYNQRATERVGGSRFWRYGISDAQIGEIFHAQGGRCAICARPDDESPLVVDHDHSTGAVRGMLCTNCNTAIGKLRDSPDILSAAIAYLKLHGKRE